MLVVGMSRLVVFIITPPLKGIATFSFTGGIYVNQLQVSEHKRMNSTCNSE